MSAPVPGSEWTAEEIEDLFTDAITDSLELDSTARDAAKQIMREMEACGLEVRIRRTRKMMAERHRQWAAAEPLADVAAAHLRFAAQYEAADEARS